MMNFHTYDEWVVAKQSAGVISRLRWPFLGAVCIPSSDWLSLAALLMLYAFVLLPFVAPLCLSVHRLTANKRVLIICHPRLVAARPAPGTDSGHFKIARSVLRTITAAAARI
eukprot:642831-Pleurochrysis_carterae.AAC.1